MGVSPVFLFSRSNGETPAPFWPRQIQANLRPGIFGQSRPRAFVVEALQRLTHFGDKTWYRRKFFTEYLVNRKQLLWILAPCDSGFAQHFGHRVIDGQVMPLVVLAREIPKPACDRKTQVPNRTAPFELLFD
jgi:hypothetical protein